MFCSLKTPDKVALNANLLHKLTTARDLLEGFSGSVVVAVGGGGCSGGGSGSSAGGGAFTSSLGKVAPANWLLSVFVNWCSLQRKLCPIAWGYWSWQSGWWIRAREVSQEKFA